MENETYTLTLRGVLSRTIKDEDVLCKTIDNLELLCNVQNILLLQFLLVYGSFCKHLENRHFFQAIC